MSSAARAVDLTQVPTVPWAWVDEHVYAAIRGCSVKVLQRERRLNIGCPFRRINGTSIRYKLGDITAFLGAPRRRRSPVGEGPTQGGCWLNLIACERPSRETGQGGASR